MPRKRGLSAHSRAVSPVAATPAARVGAARFNTKTCKPNTAGRINKRAGWFALCVVVGFVRTAAHPGLVTLSPSEVGLNLDIPIPSCSCTAAMSSNSRDYQSRQGDTGAIAVRLIA